VQMEIFVADAERVPLERVPRCRQPPEIEVADTRRFRRRQLGMRRGFNDAAGPVEIDAANIQCRHSGAHEQRGQMLIVAAAGARDVDRVVEEQGELLGVVEIGRVPSGELDQLVEVFGSVIVPMRLRVVQASNRDEGAMVEQPHQGLITVRTVLNTSSNMGVVSRPVLVL
jgi:hypothetical protein